LARDIVQEAFAVLIQDLLSGHAEARWNRHICSAIVSRCPKRFLAWAAGAASDDLRKPSVAWCLAQLQTKGSSALPGSVPAGYPTAQAAALERLVAAKGAEALPELRACLRAGRPGVVARCAFGLVSRMRDSALPVVREMLVSEHWTERKAAAALLRRWHVPTPELKVMAESDPHPAVRHAARWHPGVVAAAQWHDAWRKRIGQGS